MKDKHEACLFREQDLLEDWRPSLGLDLFLQDCFALLKSCFLCSSLFCILLTVALLCIALAEQLLLPFPLLVGLFELLLVLEDLCKVCLPLRIPVDKAVVTLLSVSDFNNLHRHNASSCSEFAKLRIPEPMTP